MYGFSSLVVSKCAVANIRFERKNRGWGWVGGGGGVGWGGGVINRRRRFT